MILRFLFLLSVAICSSFPCVHAQTLASDPQGVTILTQSLQTSGAVNVQSFTADGTITFFGAGEKVQGPATIRARGHDQFRLDASLSSGTRSIAVSRDSGSRKEADGKSTEIPAHNRMSTVVFSFPYPAIAAALRDPTVTISYIGFVETGGRKFHQVQTIRNLPKESDPDGTLARLSRTDYFVDGQTYLVTKTTDFTHPVETLTEEYPREMELEGYTAMSGVAVPTTVRQKINGQTIWEFRVSNITFNTNLSDADFSLQ